MPVATRRLCTTLLVLFVCTTLLSVMRLLTSETLFAQYKEETTRLKHLDVTDGETANHAFAGFTKEEDDKNKEMRRKLGFLKDEETYLDEEDDDEGEPGAGSVRGMKEALEFLSKKDSGAILVTGCMGLIGFPLTRALLNGGYEGAGDGGRRVICIDLFPWSRVTEGYPSRLHNLFGHSAATDNQRYTAQGPWTVKQFKYFQGDVRDSAGILKEIFALKGEWKINGVIHLASYSQVLLPTRRHNDDATPSRKHPC